MAKKDITASRKSSSTTGMSWFEKYSDKKKDVICILILFGLILFLFHKIIFGNMLFAVAGDTAAHNSWAEALNHIRETEHVEPLWVPYIFSGMPVFAGLLFPRNVNYLEPIIQLPGRLLFLNGEMSWFVLHFFLMGLFMYMLARQLGFSQLPSLVAAITLMINPFAIGLAEVGHGSKLITLSYVPLLFLAAHRLMAKKDLLSFALLAVVSGTMILSRHPQIAFYGFLLVGTYQLYDFVLGIRHRSLEGAIKISLFALAVTVGFALSAYESLPTVEYANYSIRGGSETGVSKGLDYDYATNWSFHPLETLTYVVPSFFGFSSSYDIDVQGREQSMPLYWGWMPFTDGPVYIGIVPLFLGILALIYNRNKLALWLGLLSLFVLMLSFGRHFGLVYNLMFNYFPYFNKLRVPVIILYLIPITFGLLAANGATFLMDLNSASKAVDVPKMKKRMKLYALMAAGIVLLAFVGKSGLNSFLSDFMFKSDIDRQWEQQYGLAGVKFLHDKRFEVFWNYFVWSSCLSVGCFGLIAAYLNRKIQSTAMIFGFVALLGLDLCLIDMKYINPVPREAAVVPFRDDATIRSLEAESDTTAFRVLPIWGLREFDNTLMNFHLQMITGYSPAKLKIYQETIDSCFTRGNQKVFNMLNVKYYLAKQTGSDGIERIGAQLNPDALARAWFVDTFVVSSSKAETFRIMNSAGWEPRQTAILEKEPSSRMVKPTGPVVSIASYASSEISIRTVNAGSSLLVLSEIYYPAGWKAYIDSQETEIYKTNFILRSIVVPSGEHSVSFRFEPQSYQTGAAISKWAWIVTALMLLIGLVRQPWVKRRFFGTSGRIAGLDEAAGAAR